MKTKTRPKSSTKSNQTKKNHIPINCFRESSNNKLPNNNQFFKGFYNNSIDNKNYNISQYSYADKYKTQLKRLDMYNEMWNNSQSDEEDFYGISESLKIQPENKKNDFSVMNNDKYKINSTNTRISSATTYCDIGYRSKRLIKGFDSNINSLNTNSISKNSIKNKNKSTNNNKGNFIRSYSYYKGTVLRKNANCAGINSSINLNNSSSFINYKSINKDSKIKEDENIPKSENKNKIDLEDKEALKKVINDCDPSTLKLRTEYLIKLSKLYEIYKKFEQYSDYFRIEKREIFSQSIKNITKSFDKCNDFLLNEIKTGEIFDAKSFSNILVYYFNFSLNLIKYQKYIFGELYFLKTENMSLKRKNFLQEGELSTKNKDINDINKYILHYDLTNKVKYGKKKELSIKQIKEKYKSQESAYILTIYKLQEEIKQLTEVLEKNRYNVNNFQMVSKKLKQVQEDYENDKDMLEHQNDDKSITINILNHTIADLNDKIKELESEIQQLKDREEKVEINYIEYEAKIKNLNDIIKNKNNKIEEMEKENKDLKEKKSTDDKMLEPAETVFVPMKEKVRKRKKEF